MITSAEAILATFLSLYFGLFTPILITGKSTYRLTVLMAVASGIIFWSFLDLMNDSALLDVNQGFAGGLTQFSILVCFAVALLGLFWLDRMFNTTRRLRKNVVALSYGAALLVAAGIGFHSFGEGLEIGSLIGYSYLSSPTSLSIVSAIGGIGSGVAYLLHKFLEGFVVGVFAATAKAEFKRNLGLGLLAVIPTMIGVAVALVMTVDATFFFGVGAVAAIYIEYKLIPNLFRKDRIMIYIVALLCGFYLMYLAGLFHSYTTIF